MMKCSKQKQSPDKQSDNNACNPFMACPYGNFYLSEKTNFDFTNLPIDKIYIIPVNDNRLSENLTQCWHPPQMFSILQNL